MMAPRPLQRPLQRGTSAREHVSSANPVCLLLQRLQAEKQRSVFVFVFQKRKRNASIREYLQQLTWRECTSLFLHTAAPASRQTDRQTLHSPERLNSLCMCQTGCAGPVWFHVLTITHIHLDRKPRRCTVDAFLLFCQSLNDINIY